MRWSTWSRRVGATVVAAVGMSTLSGAACQPAPATPPCGLGRHGEPSARLSNDGDHLVFLSDRTDLGTDRNSTACDVFVRTLSTGVVERVTASTAVADATLAISSDGSLVLYATTGGTIHLVDRTTGADRWSVAGGRSGADLTSDGRYLVWVDGLRLARLDRVTGEQIGIDPQIAPAQSSGTGIVGVSVSDDGSLVAAASTSGTYLWRVADGATDRLTTAWMTRAEISPDGARIAIETRSYAEVSVYVRATGVATPIPSSWDLQPMAWTTDGAWLLFTSSDWTLAGDPPNLDPVQFGALAVYAQRVRDGQLVRLYQPGLFSWPTGSTVNAAWTGTNRNSVNSPQTERARWARLEP